MLPLIVIIFGYMTCTKAGSFSGQQLNIIFYAPYVILFLTAAIAWRFNRSRFFFLTVVFTISLFARYYQETKVPASNDINIILCILLTFNILVFTILKERGIISIWGILRFAFIILQTGFAFWIISPSQPGILKQLNRSPYPVNQNPPPSISHIALLIFVLALIILIIRIILYQASQDISLLCILIALFLMQNADKSLDYSVYYAVVGLILIISILKDTYLMAYFDELTGLPSRRTLNQDMMKLGMKYSIAMLDIDFFKRFNDTYGHDTGDEVLKFIASIMKDVKGGGKAYRYGGEEFTILFPGKKIDDVLPALEELRKAIAHRGFIIRRKRRTKSSSKRKSSSKVIKNRQNLANSKKVYIHVNIGAANKDDKNKTAAMVLKAADTALYKAKKKGRNRVCK